MSTCSSSVRPFRVATVVAVALAVFIGACGGDDESPPTTTLEPTATAERTVEATPETPTAASEPTLEPETPPPATDTPVPDTSIVVACGDIRAPLDKQHRLTSDCVPPDLEHLPGEMVTGGGQLLRSAAAAAYRELFAAAQADGYTILAASAYRSYQAQIAAYQASVNRGGQAYADRVSARPGHSEHQLGTTADVTSASGGYSLEGFEGTREAAWLAANSWKYGFIISYPEGKESITGYVYEPWHIRWLGKDEAKRVKDSGLTLHEWLLR